METPNHGNLKVVPDAASLRYEFRVSTGRKAISWRKMHAKWRNGGFFLSNFSDFSPLKIGTRTSVRPRLSPPLNEVSRPIYVILIALWYVIFFHIHSPPVGLFCSSAPPIVSNLRTLKCWSTTPTQTLKYINKFWIWALQIVSGVLYCQHYPFPTDDNYMTILCDENYLRTLFFFVFGEFVYNGD